MGGFKKGRAYQFSPAKSHAHNAVSPHSNAGLMRRVRYEYVSDERGRGTTLALFRSCAGGWRESFTPAQLGDYEVREAKE